jgi:hypothetical protein
LALGPAVDEHAVDGPPRFHVTVPVGATEPATPVIVAVKVTGAPKMFVNGVPTIEIVGTTGATTIVTNGEFPAL